MYTVRRTAAAALLGAALVLSACDGAGDPEATENTPMSDGGGVLDDRPGAGDEDADAGASDSGGGDVVAADVPAPDPADFPGMDENTPEGAEQAFKYYIAVLMWSVQSGDEAMLASLATDSCQNCSVLVREVKTRATNGALWGDTEITPMGTEVHDARSADHEIAYMYEIGPHVEPSLDGEGDAEQVPATVMVSAGAMIWDDGAWKVNAYASEVRKVSSDAA